MSGDHRSGTLWQTGCPTAALLVWSAYHVLLPTVDMLLHGALSIAAHELKDHLSTVPLPKAHVPRATCWRIGVTGQTAKSPQLIANSAGACASPPRTLELSGNPWIVANLLLCKSLGPMACHIETALGPSPTHSYPL